MPSRNPDRPNIIVFLADDQGPWALGCAGNEELRTPNLDTLAATGTRFDNWFCTSPVCSPARASLLTGKLPSQHGIHDWLRAGNSTGDHAEDRGLIEYLQGIPGYTDILAEAGWHCGISGKWHLGDAHHPQKGFSFWKVHARGGGSYMRPPLIRDESSVTTGDRYVTDIFSDWALEFLEEDAARGAEDPFYLSVHYTAPHSPWDRPEHPPEFFDPYFNDCPFASVPDEPANPRIGNNSEFFESPEKRREDLSGYFGSITAMDAQIGRILTWLDGRGLRDNTLVFFTSDNGMNMGHHGLCGKGNGSDPLNFFETSVKVPAILSWPGRVPTSRVDSGMRSHYDFMPTLLDLLGLEMPDRESYPGRSFAPSLSGSTEDARETVVVFEEYGPNRMIRDQRYKYIHRYSDAGNEFYDLETDPDERRNRIDDPACRAEISRLHGEMEAWFSRYVDPVNDGARTAATGRGQLDRCYLPQEGNVPFAQGWPGVWSKPSRKA